MQILMNAFGHMWFMSIQFDGLHPTNHTSRLDCYLFLHICL